jgi:hypothetical protein
VQGAPIQRSRSEAAGNSLCVKDQYCVDIEWVYGTFAVDFGKWNLEVKGDCSGLWLRYYVGLSKRGKEGFVYIGKW